MALSIKTEEADALAREVAALAHESLTQAVTTALRERRDRLRTGRVDFMMRAERIAADYAHGEVVDDRTPDEIIGYDERGLPA